MSKEIPNPPASHSGAQPPIERDPAKISHPSKRAAGVMGVLKSIQHTFGEMGPARRNAGAPEDQPKGWL